MKNLISLFQYVVKYICIAYNQQLRLFFTYFSYRNNMKIIIRILVAMRITLLYMYCIYWILPQPSFSPPCLLCPITGIAFTSLRRYRKLFLARDQNLSPSILQPSYYLYCSTIFYFLLFFCSHPVLRLSLITSDVYVLFRIRLFVFACLRLSFNLCMMLHHCSGLSTYRIVF